MRLERYVRGISVWFSIKTKSTETKFNWVFSWNQSGVLLEGSKAEAHNPLPQRRSLEGSLLPFSQSLSPSFRPSLPPSSLLYPITWKKEEGPLPQYWICQDKSKKFPAAVVFLRRRSKSLTTRPVYKGQKQTYPSGINLPIVASVNYLLVQ